ncbi:MAG TPA: hypothetical protein VFR93_05500 [Candidatus Limnocylindrales bacterium]|nr:hypothetical protein [Candidatus Limnocylindrales bacterium]
MNSYATTELVRYRQAELLAEAKAQRLAADAKAHRLSAANRISGSETRPAPWESTLGRVRHAFSAFATLPHRPQVRLGRTVSNA